MKNSTLQVDTVMLNKYGQKIIGGKLGGGLELSLGQNQIVN